MVISHLHYAQTEHSKHSNSQLNQVDYAKNKLSTGKHGFLLLQLINCEVRRGRVNQFD